MSVSIERKAAAFDALCRALRGKAQFVRTKSVPVQSTSSRDPGSTVHNDQKYRVVHVYKWEIYGNDSDDFAELALKLSELPP